MTLRIPSLIKDTLKLIKNPRCKSTSFSCVNICAMKTGEIVSTDFNSQITLSLTNTSKRMHHGSLIPS